MPERGVKQAVSEKVPCNAEIKLIDKLSSLNDRASAAVEKLENDLKSVNKRDVQAASQTMAHLIIPDMEEVRALADEMETLTSADYWPYPTYFDLLYSVK